MKRTLDLAQYYHMRPDEFKPGDQIAIKVVAVVGHEGDWAAYRGMANWEDEQVATEGDKINREAAVALFPSIASDRYYRP